ncbi:MAG TPA: zf-HC2 domain-containing protein [Candidatus Acidoferrales bacterium]|nr:zf-HC2 domain-containing protein [Candidatus Acidoferrales bacterium]
MNARNEHEEIRQFLSLAAAEALEPREEQRVAAHLRTCSACAEELRQWQEMGGGLRRLPTPHASPSLVERTLAMAQAKLTEESERRFERKLLALGVAFSWVLVALSWPLAQLFASGWMSLLGVGFAQNWENFAVFTALCWLAGSAAAIFLARYRERERRLA